MDWLLLGVCCVLASCAFALVLGRAIGRVNKPDTLDRLQRLEAGFAGTANRHAAQAQIELVPTQKAYHVGVSEMAAGAALRVGEVIAEERE